MTVVRGGLPNDRVGSAGQGSGHGGLRNGTRGETGAEYLYPAGAARANYGAGRFAPKESGEVSQGDKREARDTSVRRCFGEGRVKVGHTGVRYKRDSI